MRKGLNKTHSSTMVGSPPETFFSSRLAATASEVSLSRDYFRGPDPHGLAFIWVQNLVQGLKLDFNSEINHKPLKQLFFKTVSCCTQKLEPNVPYLWCRIAAPYLILVFWIPIFLCWKFFNKARREMDFMFYLHTIAYLRGASFVLFIGFRQEFIMFLDIL